MIKDMAPEEFMQALKQRDMFFECPIKKALELLSGKWRTRVLFEMSRRSPARFGELKRNIPEITNTMLTSTLRELEKGNIIFRVQYNEIPPRVEYSLTECGEALLPIFYEAAKWCEQYFPDAVAVSMG